VLVTIVFAAGISTWGATEGAQRWADQLTDATVEAADPPVWIELVLAANEGEIIEADGSTTCVVRLSQRVLINADGAVRVDPEALPFRPKECMKDL
jgi:hypothetical protein